MKKYLLGLFLLVSLASFAQDLVVTGVNVSGAVDQYGNFADTITFANQGIVPIGEFGYKIFLSKDQFLDYNLDEYVGGGNVNSIESGESEIALYLTTPTYTAAGQYYLITVVDPDNEINETDENNNLFVTPGFEVNVPDFDFSFSSLTLDKLNVSVSDNVYLTFTIHNSGSSQIGYLLPVDWYLSTDVFLSEDDLYTGELSAYPIPGTSDYSELKDDPLDFNLIIPQIAPGSYYLLGKVNQSGDYSVPVFDNESDMGNNVMASPMITIGESKADLEILDSYIGQYLPGADVPIYIDVKNNGSTPIFGYFFNLYWSKDLIFDAADIFDNHVTIIQQRTLPGDTTHHIVIFGQLYHVPYGIYYPILVINPNKILTETNYDNNTFAIPTSINYAPPSPSNLTITEGHFKEKYYNTDIGLTILLTYRNSGEVYGSNFPYNRFTIKDAQGIVKATYDNQDPVTVDPENSVIQEITISLATALPVGNYTVEVSCTYSYSCFTNDYSIPLAIIPAPYALTGLVKGEDDTPITAGKLFLYQKADNGVVRFVQKVDPTSGSDFTFELDAKKYTLYFIPDATVFSAYVPTIFGKTVTLKQSSFFNLTKDSTVVFEILKLEALASGSRKVTGTVTDSNASGRLATNDKIYSIILLNNEGLPVAVTQTDSNGSYRFKNLPADDYKIVVSGELDAVANEEPFAIDIKQHDVTVDFALSSGDVMPNLVTGIETMDEAVNVYPNPTHGMLKLSDVSSIQKIEWVDVLGKTEQLPLLNDEVDVTRYKEGLYLLKVQRNRSIQVLKVIKE